jgi:hypothetical protein
VIVNAQQLTSSRWCAAQFCPHDSEPNSELCTLHIRLTNAGVPITLHHVTQPNTPDPSTQLCCLLCSEWKPDTEFSKRPGTARRGRRGECRNCSAKRRARYRSDPVVKAREAEDARIRAQRRRDRINGLAT